VALKANRVLVETSNKNTPPDSKSPFFSPISSDKSKPFGSNEKCPSFQQNPSPEKFKLDSPFAEQPSILTENKSYISFPNTLNENNLGSEFTNNLKNCKFSYRNFDF